MVKASGLKKGDFRVDPIFIFVLSAIVLAVLLFFLIPSFKHLFQMLIDTVGKVIEGLLQKKT